MFREGKRVFAVICVAVAAVLIIYAAYRIRPDINGSSSSTAAASAAPQSSDDESAAVFFPAFTEQVILHVERDDFDEAQVLAGMNSVDPKPTYGAAYEQNDFSPCVGRAGPGSEMAGLSAYITGNKGPVDPTTFSNWLILHKLYEQHVFQITFTNASMANSYGNSVVYTCAVVSEHIQKYIPPDQRPNGIHNGFAMPMAKRMFNGWTYRNRYSTPVPGRGDVKVLAGTFTYSMEPLTPFISFGGTGIASVKVMLNPDTGQWNIVNAQLRDPPLIFEFKPISRSTSQ